ncbi:hypothetical protein Trydic_g18809 [Trypoxylus dichotomus]
MFVQNLPLSVQEIGTRCYERWENGILRSTFSRYLPFTPLDNIYHQGEFEVYARSTLNAIHKQFHTPQRQGRPYIYGTFVQIANRIHFSWSSFEERPSARSVE